MIVSPSRRENSRDPRAHHVMRIGEAVIAEPEPGIDERAIEPHCEGVEHGECPRRIHGPKCGAFRQDDHLHRHIYRTAYCDRFSDGIRGRAVES